MPRQRPSLLQERWSVSGRGRIDPLPRWQFYKILILTTKTKKLPTKKKIHYKTSRKKILVTNQWPERPGSCFFCVGGGWPREDPRRTRLVNWESAGRFPCWLIIYLITKYLKTINRGTPGGPWYGTINKPWNDPCQLVSWPSVFSLPIVAFSPSPLFGTCFRSLVAWRTANTAGGASTGKAEGQRPEGSICIHPIVGTPEIMKNGKESPSPRIPSSNIINPQPPETSSTSTHQSNRSLSLNSTNQHTRPSQCHGRRGEASYCFDEPNQWLWVRQLFIFLRILPSFSNNRLPAERMGPFHF